MLAAEARAFRVVLALLILIIELAVTEWTELTCSYCRTAFHTACSDPKVRHEIFCPWACKACRSTFGADQVAWLDLAVSLDDIEGPRNCIFDVAKSGPHWVEPILPLLPEPHHAITEVRKGS